MEKHIELENLLSYSSEDLAEGYFDADVYAEELKYKLQRYQKLVRKETSKISGISKKRNFRDNRRRTCRKSRFENTTKENIG